MAGALRDYSSLHVASKSMSGKYVGGQKLLWLYCSPVSIHSVLNAVWKRLVFLTLRKCGFKLCRYNNSWGLGKYSPKQVTVVAAWLLKCVGVIPEILTTGVPSLSVHNCWGNPIGWISTVHLRNVLHFFCQRQLFPPPPPSLLIVSSGAWPMITTFTMRDQGSPQAEWPAHNLKTSELKHSYSSGSLWKTGKKC